MEAQALSDKAIKKKILSMVIPITAENILQMTAGLVSMAMVGRISAVAVGAIGLSNVIMRLIWAVFKGISIGTTILVAQSYGAGIVKKLAGVSVQGILLSIAFAALFLVLLLVSPEQILEIFGAGPELITNATVESNGFFFLGILGYKACEIAYTKIEGWLEERLGHIYIYHIHIVLKDFFDKNLPEVKIYDLEGT